MDLVSPYPTDPSGLAAFGWPPSLVDPGCPARLASHPYFLGPSGPSSPVCPFGFCGISDPVKIKEKTISISTRQQKSNERFNAIEPKAWSTVKDKEEIILYISDNKKVMRGLISWSLKPGLLSKLNRKLYLYQTTKKQWEVQCHWA